MPPVVAISDPLDPRIAVFRDVRDRDLAGRHAGFIAEGEVVLRALAAGRHRAQSLLIAAKRVDRLRPLIGTLGEGVRVYVAEQPVMDAIAGFPIHRGVLAFGERAAPIRADALLRACPAKAIVLVLFGIANHDNLGGLFRNAAAFGAAGVLMDSTCCDPLYRKAIRVSVGAALTMPFARLELGDDPVAMTRAHGFAALALSPGGTTPLRELPSTHRAALFLGAEGAGLPEAILSASETVAIPMATGFDSLNVATTSGIVLHHLASAPPRI